MRWLWLVALLASCDWVFRLDAVHFDADPPSQGRRVFAGSAHTCSLDRESKLSCWGRNVDGETGRASPRGMLPEPGPVGTDTWATLATGGETTCGIQEGGALLCWGNNDDGQVGDSRNDSDPDKDRRMPTPVTGGGVWIDVAINTGHGCGIKEDGTAHCWGMNDSGELGNGGTTRATAPTPVSGSVSFTAISVGDDTSCAIAVDKSLYCWGSNTNSEFGTSTPASSTSPAQIAGLQWNRIAVGHNFACGITSGNELRCWGDNSDGQVGDGTQTDRASPTSVNVPAGLTWTQVTANEHTACARTEDGRVFCWGESTMGQLLAFDDSVLTPTEIMSPTPSAWADVSVGDGHVCLVNAAQELYCAGKDGFSQLGDGGTSSPVPSLVPGKWKDVAVGKAFTCGIDMATNKVNCAGRNASGQLGTGNDTYTNAMTPTAGTALDNPVDVVAGNGHACAQNGTNVVCWGSNYRYQLGLVDDNDRSSPTPVVADATLPSANMHTCMIKPPAANRRLFCWGANDRLQINSTGADVTSPFLMAEFQQWIAVATGRYHTCAIENVSTAVYCQGDRTRVGATNPPASDVATLTATNLSGATSIAAGAHHTCAVAGGGIGYCWGSGGAGQLGLGSVSSQSAPAPLPSSTWRQFAGGELHTCGIQTDGSLHCWGDNTFGQLGTTSPDSTTTPAIVTQGPWKAVSAGEYHTCAITMNDDLYCWGNNNDGELANGSAWRAELVLVR